MRLRSALLAAPLVLALGLGATACGRDGGAGASGTVGAPGFAGKFTAPEYVMGSPAAKHTVVEYLSNTCSHCARFDAEVFPQLKHAYVDTGKVKWVIREFLTPPEQFSALGFVLARCTGEKRYWSTVERLFHAQEELFKATDPNTVYAKVARDAGLSDSQYAACKADDAAFTAVSQRAQKAIDQDKIGSTPTFIIDGKTYDKGELTLPEFKAALAAAGVS